MAAIFRIGLCNDSAKRNYVIFFFYREETEKWLASDLQNKIQAEVFRYIFNLSSRLTIKIWIGFKDLRIFQLFLSLSHTSSPGSTVMNQDCILSSVRPFLLFVLFICLLAPFLGLCVLTIPGYHVLCISCIWLYSCWGGMCVACACLC